MASTVHIKTSGARIRTARALAFALLAGGSGAAWGAVTWTTGSNNGNWIWTNPATAEVGIGTAGTTDPAEKLTIAGGNVLVDNNKFYKGKTTGGASTNLIGLDGSNNVSIYGGKITVPSSGNIQMGSTTIGGNASVAGNISVFGTAQVTTGANIGGPINLNGTTTVNAASTFNNYALFNGKVGINFTSSISDFYVLGKSNFNGQVNVVGGQMIAESGFQSLGSFWASNAEVNSDAIVHGILNVGANNGSGMNNFNGTNEFWGLTETDEVRVWGDLSVSGAKNFVQPHPMDDTKQIVYIAAEAGEALTLARGVSRTEDGRAIVKLPDDFALVTSEEVPLTVQLTVEGAPALIYVVSKSKEAIEVKMKDSDFSEFRDVAFDYFVQGVRDGFEDHVAIQDIHPAKGAQRISPKRARYNERVAKMAKAARKRAR